MHQVLAVTTRGLVLLRNCNKKSEIRNRQLAVIIGHTWSIQDICGAVACMEAKKKWKKNPSTMLARCVVKPVMYNVHLQINANCSHRECEKPFTLLCCCKQATVR